MDAKRFWNLIEQSRKAGLDTDQAEALTELLCELPPEEILDFQRHYHAFRDKSYTIDLWGAAYLINGGCSDDGFDYFRNWLIAQGKRVYERALKNPDTLADVVDGEDEVEDEAVCYAAGEEYGRVTGKTGSRAFYNALQPYRHGPGPPRLADRWNFDDDEEVRRRFPRLARMYLPDEEDE